MHGRLSVQRTSADLVQITSRRAKVRWGSLPQHVTLTYMRGVLWEVALVSAVVGREKFDPTLYNEDLAPIPEERRNWNWINYSTVWMGMVHNEGDQPEHHP